MQPAPSRIIAWIVVGLIGGWLADLTLASHGFGIVGDLVPTYLSVLIGDFVVGLLAQGTAELTGSIVLGVTGAAILVAIVHLFTADRTAA